MLNCANREVELPYFLKEEISQDAIDRMREAISDASIEEILQYYHVRALKSGSEEAYLEKVEKVVKLFRDIHQEAVKEELEVQKLQKEPEESTQQQEDQKDVKVLKQNPSPLPLRQLSPQHLLKIMRLLKAGYHSHPDDDIEEYLEPLRLDITQLFSQCAYIPKVVSLVEYQKHQHCDVGGFPRLSTWNVEDLQCCRELTWLSDYCCNIEVHEVLPLLGHLEFFSIDFNFPDHDDDPKLWHPFLEKVLTTVTESETKRPLKKIKITRPFEHEMPLPLGPTRLFGFGTSRNGTDYLGFYTFTYKHGTIIFVDQGDYPFALDFIFVENYSRSALFDAIWSYFCPFKPVQKIIDGFMNSPTAENALGYLRKVTEPFVAYRDSLNPVPQEFPFV